ncbi:hypothetical protein AJ85_09635 [Alkalihalobacillus alcalophilus ATCC 27647 = CGMCC 1.3604]|uniref:CamS family sex pheromone protein n=1 Tax=Alkalihalobacillus alcalophilus ATCC 27647 = CGMCC 1.3604 TaxID=1218173 RepID=A0A094YS20_ALKAL|nr:CamS family sex pheromone protein [Alkalihalobacillus alcalophilus]KGA96252.1 hypothetical protein BALCAV_0217400 [Alkalihalobacillus alcalophilus ATCC 27647 = CGMCC 1.3604]MED1562333.1 CamS family sex pheromone protein [Alkalihalobacillus alcalophilus]THG90632.1 hypothetical protein AJ85_09635 [Alkalihalobacillus alcalophilus ATCC 27647 = CGMCC 1.3604]
MKKCLLLLSAMILVLSGCIPILQQPNDDISIEDEPATEDQDVAVIPHISNSEDYYRSILYDGVYPHGETRGLGTSLVSNRLDLDQFEIGLTRVAQEYFDNERYFFREGQFLSSAEVNSWIRRYDEDNNPSGLNPALFGDEDTDMREREEGSPRYLSHLIEHNYLVEKENGNYEVGGIVIGLSLNSVYNFNVDTDSGRYFYSVELEDDNILEEGQKIAEEVVNRIRSNNREEGAFQNIPIVVALFQEQPRQAAVPGNYIARSVAEPNEGLSRWQDINEQYYLFPSTEANRDVRGDADQFNLFKDDIQGFFETYVGVVGRGFYNNDQLQELTVEISLQYQGKTEIVALSQFVANRIKQRYQDTLKVNVYINSVGGKQEAQVIRNPNEEPLIHINQ